MARRLGVFILYITGVTVGKIPLHSPFTKILPQATTPVYKFRSKEYSGEPWFRAQTLIVHHLEQEELMAFAPKARVAQADTQAPQAPQEPPVIPFPFMKLPLELRTMIYRIHFAQPAEPHHLSLFDDLPFGPCSFRMVNGGVPVRVLWTLSKDLYHEAMPLYFKITDFTFNSLESLAQFLDKIGPYHRQHVSSVNLNIYKFDSSMARDNRLSDDETYAGLQAVKLLRNCPALRRMKFSFSSTVSHMAETSELFRAILKIRGLDFVDVSRFRSWPGPSPADLIQAQEHNEQALQVLKRPYRAAAVKKREERGISNVVVPRTFFGSINKSEVRGWFDVRMSKVVMEFSEDSASRCTAMEYLKREKNLVEASFGHVKDEQSQVLQPL